MDFTVVAGVDVEDLVVCDIVVLFAVVLFAVRLVAFAIASGLNAESPTVILVCPCFSTVLSVDTPAASPIAKAITTITIRILRAVLLLNTLLSDISFDSIFVYSSTKSSYNSSLRAFFSLILDGSNPFAS
ncbi:hypothetical protein [Methanosphaera cuniculi]|uniref:hypothetical protein n=1 Tax=Methanosphaera cuniculi TaxID=1077256 RepID=UPI0026EF5FBA|nr:hypothetical protein [Methanosphaera cuniculi]